MSSAQVNTRSTRRPKTAENRGSLNCSKRRISREKLDSRKRPKTAEEAENRGVVGSIPTEGSTKWSGNRPVTSKTLAA